MKMIKMIGYLILIIISNITYSQSINLDSIKIQTKLKLLDEKGLVVRNKIYLNDEGLIFEKIFEYKNLKPTDLIKIIKNWGGETYTSFKNVLVNETDNQLVIRYSNGNVYSPSYTKLIIDIKENKIRVRVYDEGLKNLSLYFQSIFTSDINKCCVNGSGEIKNRHSTYIENILSTYNKIILNPYQLNDYILKNQSIKKEENW